MAGLSDEGKIYGRWILAAAVVAVLMGVELEAPPFAYCQYVDSLEQVPAE